MKTEKDCLCDKVEERKERIAMRKTGMSSKAIKEVQDTKRTAGGHSHGPGDGHNHGSHAPGESQIHSRTSSHGTLPPKLGLLGKISSLMANHNIESMKLSP
jgi:hypothetical protein